MTSITPTSQSRKRGTLPPMTGRMLFVLKRLTDARSPETAVPLRDVHGRTRNTLLERDWITESPRHDEPHYYLTGRGAKALNVYSDEGNRWDGICPTCCDRPRGVFDTGKRMPYCEACNREHGRKQYAMKGWQLKAETPCSRCHKRPRKVFPSGKRIAYCDHCRTVLRRKERRRKHKRKLALIAAGKPPLCLKCDQPVHHSKAVVYDYCRYHYYEYQRAYQRDWSRRKRAFASSERRGDWAGEGGGK
jgi:hypothetical protein